MGEIYWMILITVWTAEEDRGMVVYPYLWVSSWACWNQWGSTVVTLTYSIFKHTSVDFVCTFPQFAGGETEIQKRCAICWYAIYPDFLFLLLPIVAVFKPQQQKGLLFRYHWCVFLTETLLELELLSQSMVCIHLSALVLALSSLSVALLEFSVGWGSAQLKWWTSAMPTLHLSKPPFCHLSVIVTAFQLWSSLTEVAKLLWLP